jgi:hypothetical protein
MARFARVLIVLAAGVVLVGCDAKPTTPADDPETIKKLQEQQKQGSGGEKPEKK